MQYVIAAILIIAIFIMGFIGGIWFGIRKVRSVEVSLPKDMDEEEIEKIAKDLVDRMNKINKRDE